MSIPSKPTSGGPPLSGVVNPETPPKKTIKSWQVPKLKIAFPPPQNSITPASSSRTSFSINSSPPMAPLSAYDASPDTLKGFELAELDRLPPLTLPKSPPDSQPTSPPVDPSMASRPTNMIRRFSRGASNRLRGRASLTNIKSRDQHAGSVVRRRSDSRGVVDGSYDISDLELEDTVEEEADDSYGPLVTEVTLVETRPLRNLSRRSSEKDGSKFHIAPHKLTVFTKITKKKKKQLRFGLDEDSAKIYWSRDASTPVRKQIYIDDMREIRVGETARSYLAEFSIPEEHLSRWLTIVYLDPERSKGRPIKFMHLVAPDNITCDQWASALKHFMKARDKLMSEMAVNKEKHWVSHWYREMIKRFGANDHAEEDEKMDFASIRKTCRNFSIYKSDRVLRLQFEDVDRQRCGTLNQQQYLEFFRRLTERRDIRRVFDAAKASGASTMRLDDFTNFLQRYQMVDVSADPAHWLATFHKFASRKRTDSTEHPDSANALEFGMSFEAFRDFLSSSSSSPLRILRTEPRLDRPLNEYFISSSHNTYLEGRQFRGESSPEMYIEALKKGCRCIEIDCENGVDGRPCVTHVKTGTSRASFLECIKVINQYAFWASDYPLIVSLEVHCNAEQQKIMAEIMKEQFGARLLLDPLPGFSNMLPTPEDLKRRILIKVKVPHEDDSFPAPPTTYTAPPMLAHRRQRSLSAPNPRIIQPMLPRVPQKTTSVPSPQLSHAMRSITLISSVSSVTDFPSSAGVSVRASSSDDSDVDAGHNSSPKKSKSKSNIVKDLGELGVYTRGVKFGDWKTPESRAYNHVYSFNENTFENRCKTSEGKAALEKHNVRCLMRVYPRAMRIYSSNFDPLPFWGRGVQMVATNWQTYDLGTQINDAMFAAGADCTGYVLKPNEMRSQYENGLGRREKVEKKVVTFSVNIISAQYLEAPSDLRPDADMNPYVEFEMYRIENKGEDAAMAEGTMDGATRKAKSGMPIRKRTRIVEGNGFDPIFSEGGDETMTSTLNTKYPSLVFVRWTVWNSPDGRSLSNNKEPLSSFTAKLDSLEQGFRHLPLYNKHGELLHSKLFCRIRKGPRALEAEPASHEKLLEQSRASDDNIKTGSGKDFLRRVFNRTPSERRRVPRDNEGGYLSRTAVSRDVESGYLSRTASTERYFA